MSKKSKKDLKFIDKLITPRGQGFSQFLTGKLNDTDGDKIPDAWDCDPNDKNKDGLRDWLKRRREKKDSQVGLGSPILKASERVSQTGGYVSVSDPYVSSSQGGGGSSSSIVSGSISQKTTRTGGGSTKTTISRTTTPTSISRTAPVKIITPTGGVSQVSQLDAQRLQQQQALARQQRLQQQQALARQQRLQQQQALARQQFFQQEKESARKRREKETFPESKKESRDIGAAVGGVVPTPSAVIELNKELKNLELQENQIDKMSISKEEKKKLKKEIRQKKSAIKKVKRGERLDKKIEVTYMEEQFGTISTEAPTGFIEREVEMTRRQRLETPLATLATPAKVVEKTLEFSKKGWEGLLFGGKETDRGGIGLGLAEKKERTVDVQTPIFGTMQDYNPLTGTGTAIKKEEVTIEVPTIASRVPGAITGAAGLGLYAVPGFGEALLVSETAKASEVLLDTEATEQERTSALIEGGVAASFVIGGGVLKGVKSISKARTAKEIAALDKAETRFLSLIDDEGKNMGTIAEIKVGKNKYYSFSESSLDDTISATTGKLLKMEKRGSKVFDFESVGFSKEFPVKKVKLPKKNTGNLNIIEVDLAGKGSISQSVTRFTKGKKGKEMLLFSDIKIEPIKLKDLPKQTKAELGAKFIKKKDLIFVEAGKTRDILTPTGIVKRTDVRTKGIIQQLKKPLPKRLEKADEGVVGLFRRPKSEKVLKESPFLKAGRLEPVKVDLITRKDIGIQKIDRKITQKTIEETNRRALRRLELDEALATKVQTPESLIAGKRIQKFEPTIQITEKAQKKAIEQVAAQRAAVEAVELKRITESAAKRTKALNLISKSKKPLLFTGLSADAGQNISSSKAQFQGVIQGESFALGQDSALNSDLSQTTNPIFDKITDVSIRQDTLGDNIYLNGFYNPKPTTAPGFTETPSVSIPVETKKFKPKMLIAPGEKPSIVQEQGYNVLVKTGKEYIKRNELPLTEQSALSFGAREVDRTPSAQFKVKKAQKNIQVMQDTFGRFNKIMGEKGKKMQSKVLDTKDKYFKNNKQKFREYKIKRGKKKALPTNRFIEKQKFRIDSEGEKRGITGKGVQSSIFRRM